MVSGDQCECAVSLKKIQHEHPYRAKVLMEDNYFKNYESEIDVEAKQYHSRQDLPNLYCTNGGLYTRLRHLLEDYKGNDFYKNTSSHALLLNKMGVLPILQSDPLLSKIKGVEKVSS